MSEVAENPKTGWEGDNLFSRAGWLPYIGAALSMTVCYIKIVAAALLPMLGQDWNLNPHFQAVLMWSLGLIAVIAVYRDTKRHGDRYGFYVSSAGLIIIVGSLYIHYNESIESLGYTTLIIGVFLNQNAILRQLNIVTQRQAADLAEWNRTLENRVAEQVAELDRVGQLKRFFSPQLADAIVAGGAGDPLKSHRRDITVVFLDLRGFTSFTETAEPEEVMGVLREYHAAMGRLILEHEGTLERFTGDGIMVFFNDPTPVPDPAQRAIRMALAMQSEVVALSEAWKRRGIDLTMGIGIAQGFATIGGIGFEGRIDYGAIGTVTNLAARLCGEAHGGEILLSQRVVALLGDSFVVEPAGEFDLKGFHRALPVYRLVGKAA
jgi:class 3 adenylate cyclase